MEKFVDGNLHGELPWAPAESALVRASRHIVHFPDLGDSAILAGLLSEDLVS